MKNNSLVTVDFACAITGTDARGIYAKIDTGEIAWAWNISTGSHLREVRILAAEFSGGAKPKSLSAAIDFVIGTQRERLRATEVVAILGTSHIQLGRLVRTGRLSGSIEGHPLYITRASLVAFLRAASLMPKFETDKEVA